MIIDTDVGGDPDDAFALVAAARVVPELALVLTGDETGPTYGPGQRARFARHLLDRCGRPDVAVVAGHCLGDTRYFCVDGLIPTAVGRQPDDVLAAVGAVCAATTGPVRWVGIGPMSNLAAIVRQAPELAGRLQVTQMGGALSYRDPSRAEHNVRLDVEAAHTVLGWPGMQWVTADVTFTPEIEVTALSPLYQALAAADTPWAPLLGAHLDRWFDRFYPGTRQHDALTLSAALGLPFVESGTVAVALDDIGRMRAAGDGVPVRMSTGARYEPFMAWLASTVLSGL
jgi:inosine-uridine nucleoside N-ribohydrolase